MLHPMAGFVTQLAIGNAFGGSHLPTPNYIKPARYNTFAILFDNIMVDSISAFVSKGNHSFFTWN